MTEVFITGADEFIAALKAISGEALYKAERKAIRKGAKIMQAAIEERAPILDEHTAGSNALPPGALKSDIVIRTTKDDESNPTCIIGPGKETAHVARFVEFGHRQITGGRSRVDRSGLVSGPGKNIGMVRAHPFIRPAAEATQAEVGETVSKSLAAEIVKAANRKTRKH